MNDIQVACDAFISFLNDDEMANVDNGYCGAFKHLKTPCLYHYLSWEEMGMAGIAHARHETVNGCLNFVAVLAKPFRNNLGKYSAYFRTVAVITQLILKNDSPVFQVEYHDEGV